MCVCVCVCVCGMVWYRMPRVKGQSDYPCPRYSYIEGPRSAASLTPRKFCSPCLPVAGGREGRGGGGDPEDRQGPKATSALMENILKSRLLFSSPGIPLIFFSSSFSFFFFSLLDSYIFLKSVSGFPDLG